MGPMKESEQAVWRRPYPSRFAPVASHRARACSVGVARGVLIYECIEAWCEHSVRNSGIAQGQGVWGAIRRHPVPTEGHPSVCVVAVPLCGAIRLSWPD